eukprot:gene39117-52146_t
MVVDVRPASWADGSEERRTTPVLTVVTLTRPAHSNNAVQQSWGLLLQGTAKPGDPGTAPADFPRSMVLVGIVPGSVADQSRAVGDCLGKVLVHVDGRPVTVPQELYAAEERPTIRLCFAD